MSLEKKKINSYENNVKDLFNYPSDNGLSPDELKAFFDGRGDNEIKKSINGIIEELVANTGASQIGSAEGNVQRELDLKVDKENGEVIGELEVSTWDGEGSVKITPAQVDGQAKIKLSDKSGFCATLGMDFDGKLSVSYGNEYINELEKQGIVYTTIEHPYLDIASVALPQNVRDAIRENLELGDVMKAKKLCLDGAEIYKNGDELVFGNASGDFRIYHSGNLKDLTNTEVELTEEEKIAVLENTGLNARLGSVEGSLDGIIALQEAYIGGEAQ